MSTLQALATIALQSGVHTCLLQALLQQMLPAVQAPLQGTSAHRPVLASQVLKYGQKPPVCTPGLRCTVESRSWRRSGRRRRAQCTCRLAPGRTCRRRRPGRLARCTGRWRKSVGRRGSCRKGSPTRTHCQTRQGSRGGRSRWCRTTFVRAWPTPPSAKRRWFASRRETRHRAFWEAPGADSTQAISIRLPVSLLDRIQAEAHRRDVPYPSLIKVWLTERVQR